MKKNVAIHYRDYGNKVNLTIPNKCPHCGRTMAPEVFDAFSSDAMNDLQQTVSLTLKCTFEDCQNYFIEQYTKADGYGFKANKLEYRPPIQTDLPDNIEKVSPNFLEIYSQATVAESEKLDQIAGVGYRKAAEFLIKDYAIEKNSDDEETIKKMMLMKVITTYLGDFPKIQNLAKAIAWIGNDETHYERRHTDKDIQDLKRFIKASAQFIAADYDADQAFDFTSNN